ncbi:MAG: Glu-tRNA(Gln) amidotransferase subunit GatD [Nanoarchaeota archaeon]
MKKNICEVGDYVEISTQDENFKGCLIPSTNKDIYVLKLDSGYNIGINKNKIKKIITLKKFSAKKENIGKIVQKKNLPTISILHTGGTIVSRVDYKTGATTSAFTPEELLAMFPEIKNIANFRSKLVRKMWSDDLRFKHFGILAKEIEKEIKEGVKGVIIGMGTDNLAVASSALSFVLENCPIPVILVGSQRSSDRGSSDAAMNLICASTFIAQTDFSGVAICMHESMEDKTCVILPACKTRKLHTSRRDAFKVVNDKAIAKVNYETSIYRSFIKCSSNLGCIEY